MPHSLASPPRLACTFVALATLAWAGAATAQTTSGRGVTRDPAAAEALFRAAIAALDKDDWATACPKFEASFQLDPSAGTSINLARCLEHDGKVAQAWAELGRARTLAREATDVRRREIESFVDSEITRVEKRLPRLRIVAKDLPPDAEITRDGLPQNPAVIGEALPVDLGEHVVVLKAPGHEPATWKISATEGHVTEVVVQPGPATSTTTALPTSTDPAGDDEKDRPDNAVPLVGIILTGVGIAGLAVGTITGLNAIAAKDDIDALGCNGGSGTCPSVKAQEQADGFAARGSDLAAVSTTAFVAGSVLVASGATLLVYNAVSRAPASSGAARRDDRRADLRIVPSASPSAGGVWVTGGF